MFFGYHSGGKALCVTFDGGRQWQPFNVAKLREAGWRVREADLARALPDVDPDKPELWWKRPMADALAVAPSMEHADAFARAMRERSVGYDPTRRR